MSKRLDPVLEHLARGETIENHKDGVIETNVEVGRSFVIPSLPGERSMTNIDLMKQHFEASKNAVKIGSEGLLEQLFAFTTLPFAQWQIRQAIATYLGGRSPVDKFSVILSKKVFVYDDIKVNEDGAVWLGTKWTALDNYMDCLSVLRNLLLEDPELKGFEIKIENERCGENANGAHLRRASLVVSANLSS